MGFLEGLLPQKSTNNTKKSNKNKTIRTTQQSIPYVDAYENGVIQSEPGIFTKMFSFGDISFKTRSDEEQESIYEHYMRFLNTLAPKEDLYIVMINTVESATEKTAAVISDLKGDEFDVYRKEMHSMIDDKLKESRNCVKTDKYLVVRVENQSVEKAMERLKDISIDMTTAFENFAKIKLSHLDLSERLEVLHRIINGAQQNFWFEHDVSGKVSVDFKSLARQGLTTKDIIAPQGLAYKENFFELGENRVGQSMYLEKVAKVLNTNFFTELASVNFEVTVVAHISPIPQDKALKMAHNQSVNINAEVTQRQQSNIKKGIDPDILPIDLKNARDQIEDLQQDLMSRDQKAFYFSINLTHFAEDYDNLKTDSKTLQNVGAKYMCSIKPSFMMQERGFTSSLPLGYDKLYQKRLLTTESLAVFIPFDEINQFDRGGFYYGVNPINKSLIVYNRLKGQNYNGLILGSSGSGKSFSAKREMTSVVLNTDSDIYIIDPDGEYAPIAKAFGGEVVKISPQNGVYLNPMDLDIDNTFDTDFNPMVMKLDFVCGIIESMLEGGRLTPTQKSLIAKCMKVVYKPYTDHLMSLPPGPDGKKRTIDTSTCPTLSNLFEALMSTGHPEAHEIGVIMERYVTGDFDTFAHRTNVNTSARLIVYDISSVGDNLKELALKVCTNTVWMKTMENRRKGKWTWFYMDEFHLLLASQSTSDYLKTIWKRARKYYGVPTGITQNVEDLLECSEVRAILNNSSFIYMMNQSPMDRDMLSNLLTLTENDTKYITNVNQGCGLIYTGKLTIPFEDSFPQNLQLYKIMTTKPEENI